MKKIITISTFFVAIIMGVYSCSRDNKSDLQEDQTANKIFSQTPKYLNGAEGIPLNYTEGGKIILSNEQLDYILNKCSKNKDEKENFKNNLAFVGIFTKTNFKPAKDDNFDGISIFVFDGDKFQHHFFEKRGNDYFEIEKLKYKTNSVMKKDVAFSVYFAKLNKEKSISYYLAEFPISQKNAKLEDDDYVDRDFLEFQTATFAENVKLSHRPSNEALADIESSSMAPGYCTSCNSGVVRGSCTSNSNCRIYSGSCSSNNTRNTLGPQYSSLFDNNILYEIRDNIFGNSIIGEKYYAFYYYSSLPEITDQLTINELSQIALALPIFYSSFSKIKNAQYQSIIFSASEKSEILNILAIFKSKNINANFDKIINSVIDDVNSLDGKTVGELNTMIY